VFTAKSQNSKERKNTSAGYIKARRGWEDAVTLSFLLRYGEKDLEWIVILEVKVLCPPSDRSRTRAHTHRHKHFEVNNNFF
jgi:hypothetical protein